MVGLLNLYKQKVRYRSTIVEDMPSRNLELILKECQSIYLFI